MGDLYTCVSVLCWDRTYRLSTTASFHTLFNAFCMEHHCLVLRFQDGSQKYYCTEDHVSVAEDAVQLTGFSNTDFFLPVSAFI
jgi:hypothetical protein